MPDAQNFPKRLVEVDLPIKAISEHSRREKSVRHGHISTLHIWWARRPLAACRAVVLASLWPDPVDEACPAAFVRTAAAILAPFFARRGGKARDLSDRLQLRHALLDFIADAANWDHAADVEYLGIERQVTAAAHAVLGVPGTRPLVLDPFAGGGAIPLEALRVGADVFASDLNPVAVLLNQVVLQDVPRYGHVLAELVREHGARIAGKASQRLADVYPRDQDGSTPIAYLWARTIVCEGPGCGADVPILPSLWLEKGASHAFFEVRPDKRHKEVALDVVQRPASTGAVGKKPGTVRRGAVSCPVCGFTTPVASVRRQLRERSGGARDSRLLAVVTIRAGMSGRRYRAPTARDLEAYRAAEALLKERWPGDVAGLPAIPTDELPLMSGVFNVPIYGHTTWASLFNARQLLTLVEFANLVRTIEILDRPPDVVRAVRTLLALAVDRLADYLSAICTWVQSGGFIGHTFAQGQSLPIKFDYAEGCPLADGSGNWAGAIDWVARVVEECAAAELAQASVHAADARRSPLPDDSVDAVVTDPPYYNAVPYADLSDFFYIWLRRTVGDLYPELFPTPTAPKDAELCEMAGWDPKRYAHKDAAYFERGMRDAVADMRRILRPAGVMVVVFAHKTTSGWEALLQALVDAGWTITASWPIDTERGGRLRAMNSAALGSSVHLVCRPKENPDGSPRTSDVGDWRAVLAELPRRIHEWLPRLASEGIVGADAIFACLGPALEVYSKHSTVEKVSGERVSLREYLEHVWAEVSREALSMIFSGADTEGLEPDGRVTAMWLWTMTTPTIASVPDDNEPEQLHSEEEVDEDSEQGGAGGKNRFILEYDAARKIAQGLGASLEELQDVVEVKRAKARLLSVGERVKYLFAHTENAAGPAKRGKKKQMTFFSELDEVAEEQGWGDTGAPRAATTTLNRVHQAMILFGAGRGEALRRFLVEGGVGRQTQFWKFAQSLSALYPVGSDEKRWVDGVLARKKGLGFG